MTSGYLSLMQQEQVMTTYTSTPLYTLDKLICVRQQMCPITGSDLQE